MSWTFENYDRLIAALGEHIVMVASALALSLAIALPLGIWSARRPRIYAATITLTGILYTVPRPMTGISSANSASAGTV